MIVDTSAVLAILLHEKDAAVFARAIESAEDRRISAANYLEAAVVIDSRGDAVARREFDRFFERSGIAVEPLTLEQAKVARAAYQDFGKGRHRAGLNFRRLSRLCPCASTKPAAALQRPGFQPHRYSFSTGIVARVRSEAQRVEPADIDVFGCASAWASACAAGW